LLLLPPLDGGLFAGGLLLLLLGGGPEEFGLDVGHLPLESGCDPSGHVVCAVVGVGVDCGLLVVLHVELSVPGPHPCPAGGGGGVPTVLLLEFMTFPAGLIVPGGTLNMLTGGGVPVLLLGFVALPIVPALFAAELLKGFKVQFGGIGTFLLHPGGLSEDVIAIGLPVLLFVGGGFVVLPIVPGGTLIMLPGGSVPVLLPGGGSAFPAEVGVPVGLTPPPCAS
jgi:hypothetical protein